MPDVQEVFRMATQKVQPEPGFVERQFHNQWRRARNRRNGAIALVAIVALAATVIAIRALDDDTGTQPGGQGTDTSGIPSAEPIPPLSEGALEPGRYVFTSFDPGLDASYRISMEVPEGYVGFEGAAFRTGTDRPGDTGVATLAGSIGDLYADACRWEGTQLDRSALSSTDGLAAALASQMGFRVSGSTDVVLRGFAGTYMERRVPARTDLSDCDEATFREYVYADGSGSDLLPGELELLWILDVDGVPLMIEASIEASLEPEMSAQIRAELVQIVESIRIDSLTA
jgi:hypothetical protein